MKKCHLCWAVAVEDLLDCGELPLCNRFLSSTDEKEDCFPLALGQCAGCGHIQLTRYPPVEALRPRFDWITYNEPQGHLNDLVEIMTTLPGFGRQSVVGAVVMGNDLTLRHFRDRGFSQTWQIDLEKDLGVEDRNLGVETLQAELTPAAAERIVERRGLSDVLVVRHVLEHTHNLHGFLEASRRLVRPGGHVVFEVPDCEGAFAARDYTVLWEEHMHYFTRATLGRCLEANGFAVTAALRPTPSLVAITQPGGSRRALPDTPTVEEFEQIQGFAAAHRVQCERTAAFLSRYRQTEGEIALFGAGHHGCIFVNLLGLKAIVSFVLDDHPRKSGLFMPGSRLPIVGSSALLQRNVRLCLSALSPESERRVFPAHCGFVTNGGRVMSIYPGRENSLPV